MEDLEEEQRQKDVYLKKINITFDEIKRLKEKKVEILKEIQINNLDDAISLINKELDYLHRLLNIRLNGYVSTDEKMHEKDKEC